MVSFFGDGIRFVPKSENARHEIKVVGVGGGGGNTVNHMFRKGGVAVDYAVCNTDKQALSASPVPEKIQLGSSLTEGLGAGSKPEVGRKAAEESQEAIQSLFPDETKMVFVTAGMGGGTGTGAAPIIARAAKSMGKLTVGIVTTPFKFEYRDEVAQAGIAEMRKSVDSLIIINNNRIFDIYSDVDMRDTFAIVNEVLCKAASSIAEVINQSLTVNVDLADTRTLLTDSGTTLLGSGRASGPDRVKKVTEEALSSPLLNDADIYGAKGLIFVVKYGKGGFIAKELDAMTTIIRERSGNESPVKWGMGQDDTLADDELNLMIIAAGFPSEKRINRPEEPRDRHVVSLAPEGPLADQNESLQWAGHLEIRPEEKQTEERAMPNGEKKTFTVYTLQMDDDNPPTLNFSGQAYQSYAQAQPAVPRGSRQEERRPYERRQSPAASPLDSSIEDVLSGGNSGYTAQSGIRAGVKQTGNRDTEPAYLRHGITINTNPPKEGRTHDWTLRMDEE